MKELYGVKIQVEEQVPFQISYRTDVTKNHVISYDDLQYEIICIDTSEVYKTDLTLYCKRKE